MADGQTTGRASTWLLRLGTALAGLVLATMSVLALALGQPTASAAAVAGAVVLAGVLAVFWLLHSRVAAPLDRLALDLLVIARDNPDHGLQLGRRHWLGDLAAAVAVVRQRLQRASQENAAALRDATERAEEQKRHLEAVLLDLSEGVIVCNLQHQILLYNQAAAALIDPPLALGLGRSIFTALTREPVEYALDRLRHRPVAVAAIGGKFVCGTADGRRLLQARLGLVLGTDRLPAGYVLALRDVGGEMAAAARRDDLLQLATEGLRAPLANLRAAIETVAHHPDLPREQRATFQNVILDESAALSERLESLARGYRETGGGQWPLAEIHSSDLLASLQRRLAGGSPLRLTAVGLPAWLYCDSLSLLVLLEHLLRQLCEHSGISQFDVSFPRADRRVYLDIIWIGAPVPAAAIEDWLDRPLVGGLGPLSGRAVLQRHGSDLWSQHGRTGEALLRLPLSSAEPVAAAPARPHPARPELYDFDLLERPLPTGAWAERPLRQITSVVFDLETTGLRPSEGDDIVELGAVRVVNGRVLTMETFDRRINPGRPIPKASIEFHGITDEMVADKPPLAVVLPQFQTFAADAVLVAHNAAFDLKFLEKGAVACGLRFDQPILDTLLISAFIDPAEPDHSLDAVAARLGIDFLRRHSALGDALVTAAILVRQIERLEERGVTSLAELLAATNMTARIRAGQRQF
ncbi:MAG: exonuclease domain-containing protein [Dongiaceae bacterium]